MKFSWAPICVDCHVVLLVRPYMGAGLNTVNHRSELSAWWHLQRQKDAKEPPIISGIHHTRSDADCVLHCYMQGLIAIDCLSLITVLCDYLAGLYWFLIDQCSSATSTTLSVSSLSFSTLLVQYCRYDTPGIGVAQSLPGGTCLLRYEAPASQPKFDLHQYRVENQQRGDNLSELGYMLIGGFVC